MFFERVRKQLLARLNYNVTGNLVLYNDNRTVPFVILMAETPNVAWKRSEDEGIWAALPTSLFGQSGDPLLAGKFGWLQGGSPALKVKLVK